MRDVSQTSSWGFLEWKQHSFCKEDWVFANQRYQSGESSRGRSDIIKSNRITPTYYRAYRTSCRSTTEYRAIAAPSLEYCDESWHTGVLQSCKGQLQMPPVTLRLPYMSTGGFPDVPLNIVTKARNKALGKLNSNAVDLGQTFGELGQTAQLMANTSVNVLRSLNALRKGDIGGAAFHLGLAKIRGRKVLGKRDYSDTNSAVIYDGPEQTFGIPGSELHNRWLELQYGWKPLMSDIYNMHSALLQAFGQPVFPVEIKAVHAEVKDLSSFSYGSYEVSGTCTTGVEIGLKYRVSDARLAALSSLGLTNPLSLAWELLPLSFVVDWFLSVGSFLNGMGAHHGLTFVAGYETHFSRAEGFKIVNNYLPAPTWELHQAAEYQLSAFGMERHPGVDFPTPGLSVSFDLNLSQLVSILALAKQRKA